jgi:hypothetical protein
MLYRAIHFKHIVGEMAMMVFHIGEPNQASKTGIIQQQ